MPEGFDAVQSLPGFALVIAEAYACDKVAVNGVDIGPAAWNVVSIPGRPQKNPPGIGSRVLFAAASSSPELANALAATGFEAAALKVESRLQALPWGYDVLTSTVSIGDSTVYEWDGAVNKGTTDEIWDLRYYSALAPSTWFELQRQFTAAHAGPGDFRAISGSPAAALLPTRSVGGTIVQYHTGTSLVVGPVFDSQ